MQELRIIGRMRESARHVGTAGLGGPVDLLDGTLGQAGRKVAGLARTQPAPTCLVGCSSEGRPSLGRLPPQRGRRGEATGPEADPTPFPAENRGVARNTPAQSLLYLRARSTGSFVWVQLIYRHAGVLARARTTPHGETWLVRNVDNRHLHMGSRVGHGENPPRGQGKRVPDVAVSQLC